LDPGYCAPQGHHSPSQGDVHYPREGNFQNINPEQKINSAAELVRPWLKVVCPNMKKRAENKGRTVHSPKLMQHQKNPMLEA
jgi:hypothetical protein